MFLLRIFSIFGGRMLSWIIFPYNSLIILPLYLKILTLGVCIFGGILGYFLFRILKFYYKNLIFIFLKIFYSSIWFLPFISTINLNSFFLFKGLSYIKIIDFGWREMIGGNSLFNYLIILRKFYQNFYKVQIKNLFFIYIIIFLLIIILFL